MPEFASRLDAIPLVTTTAERGTLFPSPSTGQRVQNLETGAIERYTGSVWAATGTVTGVVTPLQYGAVGDGATNDATALTNAINACLSSGATLFIPKGKTFYLTSWTAITTTAALSNEGEGTIQYAGSTQVAFLKAPYNLSIRDVTFTGWFRVVENDTGVVTTAVDWMRFSGCRFLDADAGASNFAYQLLIQNPCENVLIQNCEFRSGKYTAFQIGDNVYADQDDWNRIVIRDNVIDGISMDGTTAAVAYGMLVYGRDVTIEGNHVTNVDGPTGASSSGSNGASGIYTKARYNTIRGNRVTNIGNAVLASDASQINGIHIKGNDRSVSVTSPQGYDVVCTDNVVLNIGVSNTRGYGIAALHSDVNVSNNIVEEFGTKGIILADAVTGATGSAVISGNIVRQASGASTTGIDAVNAAASRVVIQGNALKVPAIGVYVRSVTWSIANVLVQSNNIDSGTIAVALSVADGFSVSKVKVRGNLASTCTYGTFFTYGTGTYSGIDITDNDFSAASTAAISGTGSAIPSGVRIQRNRGYVSENGGTSAGITTGGTIAHGLSATPTVFHVTPTTAATDVTVAAGAANLTVTFGGGGSVAFAWEARTSTHYA